MPFLEDDATYCDPRRLFQEFLRVDADLPVDLLKAVHSSLPLLRDFTADELRLWVERGNGTACAHLGVRHMWGICGIPTISWVAARDTFAAGMARDSLECFGLEAIMEYFGYGNLTGGPNRERAKELAETAIDMGLWENLLSDRTDACCAYIASIFLAMGVVPPPALLAGVTIRHDSVQNAHVFFDMFTMVKGEEPSRSGMPGGGQEGNKEEGESVIKVHWQGADYLGMYSSVILCSIAIGLKIGRPPLKLVGLWAALDIQECHAVCVFLLQHLGEFLLYRRRSVAEVLLLHASS